MDHPPERPDPASDDSRAPDDTILLPSGGEGRSMPAPGTLIGPYRIEQELGRGGMGVVLRAHDTRLNRPVAVKTLPMDVAADPDRLTRFRREAQAAARINHPNIATIYDFSETDDHCLIAMELVNGATLRQLMDQPNRLPPRDVLDMAIQITEGLSAAHAQGVVHRDLKPGNIMVTTEGRIKVLDFGIARVVPAGDVPASAEPSLTGQGHILGTIDYMSPEQVRGGVVDGRSDLFSLGAVFFEMLWGRTPFRRDTAADTMSAILNEPPAPTEEAGDRASPRFADLVLRLLAKEPHRRPASVALLEELRAIARDATTRDAQASVESKKPMSIAVLPLENISGEPDQEYIADGMTDALIHDLARLGTFRVIPRTSVMAYKGRYGSTGELARELGVDFLVEGSVLHAGDRVRISAQLIRAAGNEHLWADRYDRDVRDVLALQSEVAQAVAKAVNVTLSPSKRVELAVTRRVDPEAYLLQLKGEKQLSLRNETSFLKAMRFFEQAIEIDPTYAPAHVGLADAYHLLMTYGLMPVAETLPASRAAVAKAMELDPALAEAQRAFALSKWQAEFDWVAAEEAYRQAIAQDPTSALTVQWYGLFLGVTGRTDAGLQWLNRARELDPLSLNFRCFYGWILYFARRFEEAIPHYRKVLRIDPDHMLAHWFMGEALTELERHDEAIPAWRRACELAGNTPRLLAYFGYALGKAGLRDEALTVLARLQKRAQTDYMPPYFYALVHCGLGQTEDALNWLQKAADLPDSMIRDLLIDVPLECLRSDPRYRDLLEQVNLVGVSERPVDPPS